MDLATAAFTALAPEWSRAPLSLRAMRPACVTPPGEATGRAPIALTATTTIDRRDFGMTAYPLIVGRKVKIRIRARMVPG